MSPAPRKLFPRTTSAPLSVSFDCYREARYRKSLPTVPDYRILVVDYSGRLPDASQLAGLEQAFPDRVTIIRTLCITSCSILQIRILRILIDLPVPDQNPTLRFYS